MGIELDIGTALALPVQPHPPPHQEIMMANVPGSERCVAYLHTRHVCTTADYKSISIPAGWSTLLTHYHSSVNSPSCFHKCT